MELRPGYKHSDVGVIPDDWDAKAIGEEIDLLTGFPFPSSGYSKSGVRLLRGSNIKRGQTDWSDDIVQSWPEVSRELARYSLQVGDLVVSMDGSLVGRSFAQLRDSDLPALLLQRVARIRGKKMDVTYLRQFVGSDQFIKYVDSMKTVTAIPHISPGDIRRFTIPVPPTIEEQRAIAQALSDVDALLAALDQVIAKKRDLKQATMQQLLTGETRLPGFIDEWQLKRLGDVVDTDPENLGNDTTNDFVFNYISLEDVDCGQLRSHSEQIFANAPSRARRKLKTNDVLVSTVRPNLQSHLLFKGDTGHWVCSTGFCVIRCREGVTCPAFVFSHFFAAGVNRQIDTLLTGSNYPAINSGDVRNLEIKFPNYIEQCTIATVLAEMDAELSALEARRDKTRNIKQAMMQELLTGKTRLVEPRGANA